MTLKLYVNNLKLDTNKLIKSKKIVSSLKTSIEKCFLTSQGKIVYKNNNILLLKLQQQDQYTSCLEKNFIKDYDIYINREKWSVSKKMNYLPKNCIPIEIKKEIYDFDSKCKFVIEYVDDKRVDYYFETTYQEDDFILKEQLFSFLNDLKNC
jgi:hypothetical protein